MDIQNKINKIDPQIEESWKIALRQEFDKEYFKALKQFLKEVPIQHNYNNDHRLQMRINTWRLKDVIDANLLITYLNNSCNSEIRKSRINPEVSLVRLYDTSKIRDYITIRGKIITGCYCTEKNKFVDEILDKIKKFVGCDNVANDNNIEKEEKEFKQLEFTRRRITELETRARFR